MAGELTATLLLWVSRDLSLQPQSMVCIHTYTPSYFSFSVSLVLLSLSSYLGFTYWLMWSIIRSPKSSIIKIFSFQFVTTVQRCSNYISQPILTHIHIYTPRTSSMSMDIPDLLQIIIVFEWNPNHNIWRGSITVKYSLIRMEDTQLNGS